MWKEPTASVFSRDIDFGINSGKDRVGQIGINSNYLEHTPSAHLKNITSNRYDDLTSMLTSVGLEKYIRTYIINKFGFPAFASCSFACTNITRYDNITKKFAVLSFVIFLFYDFPRISFQFDLINLIISSLFGVDLTVGEDVN